MMVLMPIIYLEIIMIMNLEAKYLLMNKTIRDTIETAEILSALRRIKKKPILAALQNEYENIAV